MSSTNPSPTSSAPLRRLTMANTPVGDLELIASATGVRAVLWGAEDGIRVTLGADIVDDPTDPILLRAAGQLIEYFAGTRQVFDLPLDPQGTPFQLAAWDQLRRIPYGETISYGEQARRLGDMRKSRAVGAANGRNPISIIVPCHRVVGSNGKLTGFAGGLDAKAWLLDLERGRLQLLTPS